MCLMRSQRFAPGVTEPGELRQRALPVRRERLEALDPGATGERCERGSLAWGHNGDARVRVAQQVVEFVGRAGDVDRYKHRTHAQARDIEQYGLQGLFDSSRNPIATRHAAPLQCGRETRRLLAQSLIAELSTRRGPEERSAWVLARGVFDPVAGIDDGGRGGLRIYAHDRSGRRT